MSETKQKYQRKFPAMPPQEDWDVIDEELCGVKQPWIVSPSHVVAVGTIFPKQVPAGPASWDHEDHEVRVGKWRYSPRYISEGLFQTNFVAAGQPPKLFQAGEDGGLLVVAPGGLEFFLVAPLIESPPPDWSALEKLLPVKWHPYPEEKPVPCYGGEHGYTLLNKGGTIQTHCYYHPRDAAHRHSVWKRAVGWLSSDELQILLMNVPMRTTGDRESGLSRNNVLPEKEGHE